MESDTLYRELDLHKGASLSEIKAAYRKVAKSCHPDAVAGSADPDRFSRAHAAYRSLLKDVMGALNGEVPAGAEGLPAEGGAASCKLIGRKSVGLDVFYDIEIKAPEEGGETVISIPWIRRDACPCCLGQGETLKRSGGGFVYKATACPRCRGRGFVQEKRTSSLSISHEMLRKGRVRVRNAGSYVPKEGRRGDLVVNLFQADKAARAV
jgi:DnaJ-class molecular chaperone